MSQNTTESQDPNSPTTSSSSTNSQMLLEKMLHLQKCQKVLLETSQELVNGYNLSYKYLERLESMSYAPPKDRVLKSLREILKRTSLLESHYASLLEWTLEQLSTNTEPSNS